jgi:hypothetical protein
MSYGRKVIETKGYVELYKDGKFQKLKYFSDRYQRRIIMDAMTKEVKHLFGDFAFHIKLDNL